MVTKVAKVGAVKTDRNCSRSGPKVGVSCMGGLLVARGPGCCATPRIHPWPKEDAIPHAYSPIARTAKREVSPRLGPSGGRPLRFHLDDPDSDGPSGSFDPGRQPATL